MRMPVVKLKTKIIAAIVIAAVIPTIALLVLIAIQGKRLDTTIGSELDEQMKLQFARLAKDMYALCQSQQESLMQTVEANMNVARDVLDRKGGANLRSDTISWKAINQFTQESVEVALPQMAVGDSVLGQNSNSKNYTPVVDDAAQMVGGVATIFQRMNARGDMIRVATNVLTKDQKRAIGTYIPVTNPDGSPNPVLASLLKGQPYRGRAFIVDKWYVTGYDPLKDASGKVIGMLFAGILQEKVPSLRKALYGAKIGASGYTFVLGGSGDTKGKYVISKDGSQDGESIWEMKDADGQTAIQTIINKSIEAPAGEVFIHKYNSQEKGETAARMKVAAAIYYAPWDWVIVVNANEEDFKTSQQQVDSALNGLKWSALIGGLVAVALALLLGTQIVVRIANQVRGLSQAADKLALGNVDIKIEAKGSDEIGDLSRSMSMMVENVQNQALVAERIASGDLTVVVTAKSEDDILAHSLSHVLETLRRLIAETRMLSQAAVDGKLDTRAPVAQFKGGYRELAQGFNQTLDAVIAPISEASVVLDRVAARDLTTRVQGNYKGDHAKIKRALNSALENLEETLGHVISGAEQVTSAANQISVGSQSVAQGASEQAGTLEEITTSLQGMSSITKQNTANAQQARALSGNAHKVAEEGVRSMHRLSQAVDRIKESADSTAKIIKTIDEIAFQTNLLALNAAVEAARAGDAGKGFAVVAEEVRNLAIRSAEAAKTTSDLIEESVKNAEGGVELNQEVLRNLNDINEQVGKVSKVMSEIATASDEQSQSVEQINTSIEQMNMVTQMTAANAEESAAAAEELYGQAAEMMSMARSFHLSFDSPSSAQTTSRPHQADSVNMPAGLITTRSNSSVKGSGMNSRKLIPFDEDDPKMLRDI